MRQAAARQVLGRARRWSGGPTRRATCSPRPTSSGGSASGAPRPPRRGACSAGGAAATAAASCATPSGAGSRRSKLQRFQQPQPQPQQPRRRLVGRRKTTPEALPGGRPHRRLGGVRKGWRPPQGRPLGPRVLAKVRRRATKGRRAKKSQDEGTAAAAAAAAEAPPWPGLARPVRSGTCGPGTRSCPGSKLRCTGTPRPCPRTRARACWPSSRTPSPFPLVSSPPSSTPGTPSPTSPRAPTPRAPNTAAAQALAQVLVQAAVGAAAPRAAVGAWVWRCTRTWSWSLFCTSTLPASRCSTAPRGGGPRSRPATTSKPCWKSTGRGGGVGGEAMDHTRYFSRRAPVGDFGCLPGRQKHKRIA
mmetsp:Transcript_12313/g.28921  ORF Transcript_12313/g.28921 Transcript_12313/m.28921 type:complete len:360 (-) Transcript_12313:57-1136(-)